MRRIGSLALFMLLVVRLGRRRSSQRPDLALATPLTGTHPNAKPSTHPAALARANISYGYDVRKGAAAYAPIIGTIGGFVVTAVVLVFEIVSSHPAAAGALGRAASLLVLGLISCLLGAFAFAAISAEQKLTPDLPAAALHAGAATTIGGVAIVAAFEVLASVYLPSTTALFAMITVGTAVAGAVLVSLVLGDAWITGPSQHWLGTRKKAYVWGTVSSALCTVVLLASGGLYFAHLRIVLAHNGLRWFIGAGIVLAVAGGIGSMFRTMRTADGSGRPIARTEASLTLGTLVAYLLVLLISMP